MSAKDPPQNCPHKLFCKFLRTKLVHFGSKLWRSLVFFVGSLVSLGSLVMFVLDFNARVHTGSVCFQADNLPEWTDRRDEFKVGCSRDQEASPCVSVTHKDKTPFGTILLLCPLPCATFEIQGRSFHGFTKETLVLQFENKIQQNKYKTPDNIFGGEEGHPSLCPN